MTMTMGAAAPTRFGPSTDNVTHFEYALPGTSVQPSVALPAFSNPWSSGTSAPSGPSSIVHSVHHVYAPSNNTSTPPQLPLAPIASVKAESPQSQPSTTLPGLFPSRSNTNSSSSSLASYGSSASLAGSYDQSPHAELVNLPQDVLTMGRLPPPQSASFQEFTTTSSPVGTTYATAPGAPFESLAYAANTLRGMNEDRGSFAAALDASQGMLAMSQETPRATAYNPRHRNSADSYGFPSSAGGSGTHSTSSSISSHTGGGFNSYYADSLSEYSTAGSDIESVASRSSLGTSRIPIGAPGIITGVPPPPHTMMGQFSSKSSGSVQKKHKCKVCDKRFTRPSSLQTHMYSHTGEKPFACEVPGCDRHFSVVSNLRRHMKVHKSDSRSDAGSDDHESSHQESE